MAKKSAKNNQKVVLTIGVSLLFLVFLLWAVQGSTVSPLFPQTKPLYDVKCDVSLSNPVFSIGSVKIGGYNCVSSKANFCFGNLLSVFGVQGNLQMFVDGKSQVQSFDLGSFFGNTVTKQISVGCVNGGLQKVVLNAITDDQVLLDSKEFNLQVG